MFCVDVQSGQARIEHAETWDRTGDLQIFGLTLSQMSYRGLMSIACMPLEIVLSHNLKSQSHFFCEVCHILSKHFQQALASIHVNVLRIISLLRTCVGPLTANTQLGNFCEFSGEREQREAVCSSTSKWPVVSFVIPSAKTQQCDPLNKNCFLWCMLIANVFSTECGGWRIACIAACFVKHLWHVTFKPMPARCSIHVFSTKSQGGSHIARLWRWASSVSLTTSTGSFLLHTRKGASHIRQTRIFE